MADEQMEFSELQVIAPCLGRGFSGINATVIMVLPELAKHLEIAAMSLHIPAEIPQISFRQSARYCRGGMALACLAGFCRATLRLLIWMLTEIKYG